MDSIVVAKVERFLRDRLHIDPYECRAVLTKMRALARTSGHALDARFAGAGLGAGPEARVAASVVDRALLGGGSATAEKDIRIAVGRWLRTSPGIGT